MDKAELRALRERLKLPRSEMAKKLGISASALYKLESGENNMSRPVKMLASKLEAELLNAE